MNPGSFHQQYIYTAEKCSPLSEATSDLVSQYLLFVIAPFVSSEEGAEVILLLWVETVLELQKHTTCQKNLGLPWRGFF